MIERIASVATALWLALVCGGGLAFVARDLLEARWPLVAVAWAAGAVTGATAALTGDRA